MSTSPSSSGSDGEEEDLWEEFLEEASLAVQCAANTGPGGAHPAMMIVVSELESGRATETASCLYGGCP